MMLAGNRTALAEARGARVCMCVLRARDDPPPKHSAVPRGTADIVRPEHFRRV